MAKENELPDSYEYILDKFGEEKLLSRYTWLYDCLLYTSPSPRD